MRFSTVVKIDNWTRGQVLREEHDAALRPVLGHVRSHSGQRRHRHRGRIRCYCELPH